VTGTVTNFNADNHTFMMTPTQYVVLPRSASPFPIHAHFVDSESKKRWGSEGPRVAVGSTITFAGFMERIVRDRNIDKTLAFVEIEVTSVAYLFNRPNASISPTRGILLFYFILLLIWKLFSRINWSSFGISNTVELWRSSWFILYVFCGCRKKKASWNVWWWKEIETPEDRWRKRRVNFPRW